MLGLYLGDGHIARARASSYVLRISCDDAYPGIMFEARAAMDAIRGFGSAKLLGRSRGACTAVSAQWKHWPAVFPQHGAGRKHERSIALEPWQRGHTHAEPEAFVRGLIHSDGCRYIARQRGPGKVYTYVRYSFCNKSVDILGLMREHLRLIGVRWTQPSDHQLAIDRRSEVAKLDEFVGPKM